VDFEISHIKKISGLGDFKKLYQNIINLFKNNLEKCKCGFVIRYNKKGGEGERHFLDFGIHTNGEGDLD